MVADMKGIGKLETLMDLVFLLFQMVVNMKVIGFEENITAKDFIKQLIMQSMMESGLRESIMASAHFSGQTEVSIKENGKIVEKMEKESSLE